MAAPDSVVGVTPNQPDTVGNRFEQLAILRYETELFSRHSGEATTTQPGLTGILGKSRQRGTGELQSAWIVWILQPCNDAKSLRITLK